MGTVTNVTDIEGQSVTPPSGGAPAETRAEVGSIDAAGPAPWTTRKSADLYQIAGWGAPYFSVNEAGRVDVRPSRGVDQGLDLYELVEELQGQGVELPMVLRFSNILEDRIRLLNECFARAIKEYDYKSIYRGVFPVKVNQQRHLVDEVVRFGAPWQFGLECGSKPELLIALAADPKPGGLVICNGYKDLTYIETALIAQRFDKTVVVVLERVEELDLVFRASEKVGIQPILGVRAKLSAKGVGRWADSSGDRAKFGLTAAEMVTVVDRLAERGALDTLKLLHFHIGSQISSIIPIKNALREAAQLYVELAKLGTGMEYLDVGGGLAVDYDGSKTDFHASTNYGLQEYAYDVVGEIQEACDKAELPHPVIVSESGRAVAAHQSVLVFDVVGSNVYEPEDPEPPGEAANRVIRELYETFRGIQPKNVQEALHDAQQAKEEATNLFKYGYLGLRDRAEVDRLFLHCCRRIVRQARRLKFVPEEVAELETQLSAIYYCNFSIFQSAPDTWAIDQIFPVMPIHRLEEEPSHRAALADLTCDSEGMIDHFLDVEEVKPALEVHRLQSGEQYIMGMFLAGAYQETLGDLHNLFGDTNAVHVRLTKDGYEVDHVIRGDSIREVLRYVQYDTEALAEGVRKQAERALQQRKITLPQMRLLMRHYEEGLRSYTYLTDDGPDGR